MSNGWAVCPVCRCVVDGQDEHAQTWHAPLTHALAFAAASSEPPPVEGDEMWAGPPVAAPPSGPTPEETDRAVTLRSRARDAITVITGDVVPAMDAYLALTTPTAAQVTAQVRTLSRVTRAMSLLARDLIRLAVRALDTTD